MRNRILIILALVFCVSFSLKAQDTYVVQQFGNTLSNWASGENSFSALRNVEMLCSKKPAFRVADDIMNTLARKNGLVPSRNYDFDQYTTCLQKEVSEGISIAFSNILKVSSSEINNYKYGYEYVSCNIKISGSFNINESALFILANNKIAGITNHITSIDKKSGKKKIEIDWSGLEVDDEMQGWGLSYNYDKAFPIGATLEYTYGKFMIGVDFGINNDKDLYTTQKVDFTNIVDYKIKRGEYDLKYFITATPSFYLKYFSIGWGFGYASFKGSETTRENFVTEYPDGSITQTGTTHTIKDDKYKFMMRPTVKGYIPCSENFFISLSVNYDWILGCKEKSGISFGAGIHFIID